MTDDNVYFKKGNGRYEPIGVRVNRDYLPDGIYYIRHHEHGRSTTSVPYLAGVFRIGDATKIDIPTICGLEDMVDKITNTREYIDMINEGKFSIHDIICLCVKKMYDIANEQQENK